MHELSTNNPTNETPFSGEIATADQATAYLESTLSQLQGETTQKVGSYGYPEGLPGVTVAFHTPDNSGNLLKTEEIDDGLMIANSDGSSLRLTATTYNGNVEYWLAKRGATESDGKPGSVDRVNSRFDEVNGKQVDGFDTEANKDHFVIMTNQLRAALESRKANPQEYSPVSKETIDLSSQKQAAAEEAGRLSLTR